MERTQDDETQSTKGFAAIWRRLDIERNSPYIAGLYLLGATFMLVRLAGGLVRAHRLCRVARVVVESHVLAVVARQSRAIGVRLVPAVAWCEQVVAPVVLGVVRPMILLPASLATGFDPQQFEALIAHELSHVRRYDLWVNLLQRFAEVVFFFHPGVWYLSRRASAERELACDDAVLAAGWSPLTYAQALVAMAERCHDRVLARGDAAGLAALSPLSAAGSSPSQFKRRVLRLLGDEPAPSMSLGRSGALAVMMLVLSAFVAPLAVVSLESPPKVRSATEPSSAGQHPSV
ncbi:MAG TPA: M56 family metallopeptidase, partial [Pirellulaceae bacterium]|nr:M56 family metallopeptidase [Pirellulaceae bacterium]